MIATLYLREECLHNLKKALRDGAEWTINLEDELYMDNYSLVIDFGDKKNHKETKIEYSYLRVSYNSHRLHDEVDEYPCKGETITIKFNNKQRRELLKLKPDFKDSIVNGRDYNYGTCDFGSDVEDYSDDFFDDYSY